jgi:beta-glucanase (GH16 family)
MRIVSNLPFIIILAAAISCSKHSPQSTSQVRPRIVDKGYTTPQEYSGYTSLWKDEFEGNAVDLGSWSFETGRGGNGWGNNELQYYTDKNASVEQGYLIITAKKENVADANYSSARMITKGKKNFLFGRIDIRAKLPEGQGIWPALWMLGANIDSVGWPSCGEIDIMELVGHEPSKVYGTMHWGPHYTKHRSKGYWNILTNGKYSDEFHVYSLIWKTDELKVLVDDKEFFTFTAADAAPDEYPFNAPHYLIFNVAVGGNWPGPPDSATKFPQQMIVDYVRVFQPQ